MFKLISEPKIFSSLPQLVRSENQTSIFGRFRHGNLNLKSGYFASLNNLPTLLPPMFHGAPGSVHVYSFFLVQSVQTPSLHEPMFTSPSRSFFYLTLEEMNIFLNPQSPMAQSPCYKASQFPCMFKVHQFSVLNTDL